MKEKIEKKTYSKNCPLIKGGICKKIRCNEDIIRRYDYKSCDYYRKIIKHDDEMREGKELYSNNYLGIIKSSLYIQN